MAMNKKLVAIPKVVAFLVFKVDDSNNNRRLGYREIFTPCLEGQIGISLSIIHSHIE
jgi:hypothetical protein